MAEILYRVESSRREELGFPVSLSKALDQVKQRAPREPLGESLRIVRMRYRLDPEQPPTQHTRAMGRVWQGTVLNFPDIGTLGVFVCKENSQHRFGNAADWAAPPTENTDAKLIKYLWDVFHWHRREGIMNTETGGAGGLPISEAIFRDKITTRAHGWTIRTYTGTFHATHVHTSCQPLLDTSLPCGVP